MTRDSWDRRAMRAPVRKIPVLPTKPAAYTSGCQYHAKGVPAGEQSTYWDLAGQFRGGDIYAFSWDARRRVWEVWTTEADWLATEREGTVARPDLAALGHGPVVYVPAPVAKSARAGKAEVVAMLRRVLEGTDWQVSEIEDLLARS